MLKILFFFNKNIKSLIFILFFFLFYYILLKQKFLLIVAEESLRENVSLTIQKFLSEKYAKKNYIIDKELLFIIKRFISELPEEYTNLDLDYSNEESLTKFLTSVDKLFEDYLYYDRILKISFNIIVLGAYFFLAPISLMTVWTVIGFGVYLHHKDIITAETIIYGGLCYISSCYYNNNNFKAITGLKDVNNDLMEVLKAINKIFRP